MRPLGVLTGAAGLAAALATSHGILEAPTPAPQRDARLAPAAATTLGTARVADTNGDLRADLFWHDAVAGQVDVWTMYGTQRTGVSGYGLAQSYRTLAIDDFNGDGLADVLWENTAFPPGTVDVDRAQHGRLRAGAGAQPVRQPPRPVRRHG